MRNVSIGIFLALLLAAGNAFAETVRCSGHIIEQNMPKAELLAHCGPPDSESDQVNRTWVYNNLGGQKVIIYFYPNDDIERIETVFDQPGCLWSGEFRRINRAEFIELPHWHFERMEERDIIHRKQSATDWRSINIDLTPEGIRAVKQGRAGSEATNQKFTEGLTAAEIKQLRAMIETMLANANKTVADN